MPLLDRLGLVFLAATAAAGIGAAAQSSPALTEETSARLVVTRVRITPTRWATLGECRQLQPEDLRVSLRGKKLDSSLVDLDRRVRPTLHALAIDTSGSMTHDLPYAQYAAVEYVRQLRPGSERAFVLTFDENVVLHEAVTDNKEKLTEAIDEVRIGARTAMLDAMYYAIRELEAHRERPVLVLLTDGADIASFYGTEDLGRLVSLRPDLTLFTIGVGLRAGEGAKPTKVLLRELAQATDGEFFDVGEGSSLSKVFASIRDILENEVTLSVPDPRPDKKPGSLSVVSLNENCKVKVLARKESKTTDPERTPIERPYPSPPQAYSSHLTAGHRKLYAAAAERQVDKACGSGGYFKRLYGGEPLDPLWFFHVGQRSVSGCGLDVVMEHGLLYDPTAQGLATHNNEIKVRARPFEMTLPAFDALPRRPEQAMDPLGRYTLEETPEIEADVMRQPASKHALPFYRYPGLAHGMSFMEMRPVLSRATFLYPEYRAWAMNKLQEAAKEELRYVEESYRRRFPDYPTDVLSAAARHSAEGLEILHRAENPSELDLQQYMAAWLGDITAHELFCRWELERVTNLLNGRRTGLPDGRFAEAWRNLHGVFFVPSYARSLTLLQPTYDVERDRIGYWRVVLPRTSWMVPRLQNVEEINRFATRDLDLVPPHPFGIWLIEHLIEREPEILSHLSAEGFRAVDLTYNVLGDPATLSADTAFRKTRVRILLATGEPETSQARTLEVIADVDLLPAGPKLKDLAMIAINDAILEELAGRAKAKAIGTIDSPTASDLGGEEPSTQTRDP